MNNDFLQNFAKIHRKTPVPTLMFTFYFPVKFAKFLRTPFVTEHLWWLLLS